MATSPKNEDEELPATIDGLRDALRECRAHLRRIEELLHSTRQDNDPRPTDGSSAHRSA